MTVLRGDKVVLIKAFDRMNQIGETYEVADFTNTTIIIRDVLNKVAVGAISVTDFDRYFAKAAEVGNNWTDWNRMVDPYGNTVAMYRTNYKKVQVKIQNDSNKQPKYFKAEACCNKKYDEFTLGFGVNLAYERCYQKALKNRIADFEKIISDIQESIVVMNTEISNSENTIKKMYRYIDKNNKE